ncbi:MAG: hypothetical protein IT563_26250 [Alphaproteobacteria bacterium]|nr:hypothetical protein [Alphaproteobacteria bacterium]
MTKSLSRRSMVAGFALAAILSPAPGRAQAVVHGADSLFSAPTIKLAWAMIKGNSEETTRVMIRVVNATSAYRFVRADGLEPFTKARVTLVETRALPERTDLFIPRARFADHPSLEILLDAAAEAAVPGRAALTIYYLGVPDTTPEFLAEKDADAYLAKMLGALK